MNEDQKHRLLAQLRAKMLHVWHQRREIGGKKGKDYADVDAYNLQSGGAECLVVTECLITVFGESRHDIVVNYVNKQFEVRENEQSIPTKSDE